jgi:PAS domain S-box-containing protein
MNTEVKVSIGLLFTNPVDKHLLAHYLQQSGYYVRELDLLPKEEWKSFAMIIVDEPFAFKFSKHLLLLIQQSEPLFLPIVICISPNSDLTHWLQLGFNVVLQMPLLKEEFASRLHVLLRLRAQTEAQFNLIYENIHIGIYRMNDSMQIIQANPAFIHILGFKTLSEVLNKKVQDLGYSVEAKRQYFLEKSKEKQKLITFESLWQRPDSAPQYLRENIIFFQDNKKKSSYYGGTIEDVTYQKKIEKDLKISEAKFRHLVDLSPYGILIECEEKILFLNEAMIKIFDAQDAEQIIGSPLLDRVPPAYHQVIKQHLRFVKEKQQASAIIQEQLIDIKGNNIDVEVLISPFTYQDKIATQVIIHDISERLHFEKQIYHLAYHDQLTPQFQESCRL